MTNREHVFCKIEHVACECAAFATNKQVPEADIYSGTTKTTLQISIARQLALLFMHDSYGISYKQISARSRMDIKSVMRCVRKAREFIFIDPIYSLVYKMMDERL